MIKRIIVAVALLFASALFAFIGMWIAPFGVGLFRSSIAYNIILAVILAVISIVTIILLCKKRLRIYSLLFIPHIIALGIVMLHVGNNLHYIGSEFISVAFKPYKSIPQIRTTSGRVIFKDAYKILLHHSDNKLYFSGPHRRYDRNGVCILDKPIDDETMGSFNEGFWSLKKSKSNNAPIYRVRFFDLSGNYILTRCYTRDPFFTEQNSMDSKEYIREYIENVDELSDGIKKFSQTGNELSENPQTMESVSSTVTETPRSGEHDVNVECPTCHGLGKHVKIRCSNCGASGRVDNRKYLEYLSSGSTYQYFGPKTDLCPYCVGGYRKCPRSS